MAVTPAKSVKVPPVTVTLRLAVVVPEVSEPPAFTMTSRPAVVVVVDTVPVMLMLLTSDFTKVAALMNDPEATVTEPVMASTVSGLAVPATVPPLLTMTAPVVPFGSAVVAATTLNAPVTLAPTVTSEFAPSINILPLCTVRLPPTVFWMTPPMVTLTCLLVTVPLVPTFKAPELEPVI